jgi:uncharacterized Rmd1/YagE family protein
MHKLIAINIADSVDIKGVKTKFDVKPKIQTSTELFLNLDKKYITVFNNGVIAFANFEDADIKNILEFIKPYLKSPQENISETININFIDENRIYIDEDTLFVPKKFESDDLLRIVMYDLSQTVGIDYYQKISEVLLEEVQKFASYLEQKGKLNIDKKEMNKFIGKSLTTKNKIVNNLYIFDVPDIAWENEELDRVHRVLSRTFDLQARIKELQYTFQVIDDNLNMFKGMHEHSRSAFLEIIVIILILIEILQTFGEKIFK